MDGCFDPQDIYTYTPKRNFCGSLTKDPSVEVRLAFLEMMGDWLLHLTERNAYTSRLLPFILSALTDEVPHVQSKAMMLLEEIGERYEKEHEKVFKEKERYLSFENKRLGLRNFETFWSQSDKFPILTNRLRSQILDR